MPLVCSVSLVMVVSPQRGCASWTCEVLLLTFDELGEALPGAAVVQRQASFTFLLHAKAGRLDLREREAEVLVQVVQFVDEVANVSSQNLPKKGAVCVSLVDVS